MHRKKILKLVLLELKRLTSTGALEPEQNCEIVRAIRKLRDGLQRRDMKLIEEGVALVATALLKKK
jgi:hypothetical protein